MTKELIILTQETDSFSINQFCTTAKQILVIDDEPDILSLLSLILEQNGFTVLTANNAHDSFDLLPLLPDLILLDVRLTGSLDGFDLCRLIKNDSRYHHIPIVFCSALSSSQSITKGFNAGAVDFLTRPFSIKNFLLIVNKYTAGVSNG